MTLREAVTARLPRVRNTAWTDPLTYYRLPLLPGGQRGGLAELYDDRQQLAHGVRPGSLVVSVDTLGFQDGFVGYFGPVSRFEWDAQNEARTFTEF